MDAKEPQDEMRAKLDALKEKIRAHRADAPIYPGGAKAKAEPKDGFGSAMSMGLKAGSEFVAAIGVGAVLGLGLDALFHTRPAFTIILFLLGVAAGTVNVIRATSPKGATRERTSPLSGASGEAKDVPRNDPPGGSGNEESRSGG